MTMIDDTAIAGTCILDGETILKGEAWIVHYGVRGEPDAIGHAECIKDVWLVEVKRASIADIADGNLPEVRRYGTFKVGDTVRYQGSTCGDDHLSAVIPAIRRAAGLESELEPSLLLATGVVVDRTLWRLIDAPEGHDIRVRIESGPWSGHYADFKSDELELT